MPQAVSIAIGLLIMLGAIGFIFWMIFRSVKKSIDPPQLMVKWLFTFLVVAGFCYLLFSKSILVPFVAVAVGVSLSFVWAPSIGSFLAKPLTNAIDGGDLEMEAAPLYSMATARRKQGHYREAIYAIQEQLARFPSDVQGQMMIAEIQADDLRDMAAARVCIQRFCLQPGHQPKNIAYALNTLAEWEMKYAQDPAAAREALEEVIRRFPDSEMAHTAAQRVSHLGPGTVQLASHEPRTIALKPGVQDIGLLRESASLRNPEEDLAATAAGYVKHLEAFPADNEVREKLASLYVKHYQRLDLAAMQLEELVGQPHAPALQVVRWLNLLADWHIQYAHDREGAKAALERLIARYPNFSHAQLARQRLSMLDTELKGQEKSHAIKLGTYETDIGLKSPRKSN